MLGGVLWSQELGSVILEGPFQFGISMFFYHSMTPASARHA